MGIDTYGIFKSIGKHRKFGYIFYPLVYFEFELYSISKQVIQIYKLTSTRQSNGRSDQRNIEGHR
jgi:hypothetical protein